MAVSKQEKMGCMAWPSEVLNRAASRRDLTKALHDDGPTLVGVRRLR